MPKATLVLEYDSEEEERRLYRVDTDVGELIRRFLRSVDRPLTSDGAVSEVGEPLPLHGTDWHLTAWHEGEPKADFDVRDPQDRQHLATYLNRLEELTGRDWEWSELGEKVRYWFPEAPTG